MEEDSLGPVYAGIGLGTVEFDAFVPVILHGFCDAVDRKRQMVDDPLVRIATRGVKIADELDLEARLILMTLWGLCPRIRSLYPNMPQ